MVSCVSLQHQGSGFQIRPVCVTECSPFAAKSKDTYVESLVQYFGFFFQLIAV